MSEGLGDALAPYLPRVVLRRLVEDPAGEVHEIDGTVVFVDLSGFTKLSERLARVGREGAERLVDVIGDTFAELLLDAYANGASLLKFGGDALLLLFSDPGHVERGCHSAAEMRRTLRRVGRLETEGAQVRLRMSVGVHSDVFPLFLVGRAHREVLTTGPAWTTVVEMEGAAEAGEIMLSPATAARLPARHIGPAKGPGLLLAGTPTVLQTAPEQPAPQPPAELMRAFIADSVAEHVAGGHQPAEHRNVAVAFIHFDGTDALIADQGPAAVAGLLTDLVDNVATAAAERRVTLLGVDVDGDGGKFMLCAGAPTATDDDEERMLLAMRAVVDRERAIPVRVGVNRGPLFVAAVGPPYRRTYTTMGDATNLAARLMARAPRGEIYVTGGVLERSATAFEVEALEPFMVKGKSRPIQAWSLGPPLGREIRVRAAGRDELTGHFPLIGREAEMAALTQALADARAGHGRLVEIVSEPGLGKSRMLQELVDGAPGLRRLSGACEAYTSAIPYRAWRGLLLQALGIPRDAPADRVATDLTAAVAAAGAALAPWLPLLAIPFDVRVPQTPEVERMAPEFRPTQLQQSVIRLLQAVLPEPTLFVFEDVHLMDQASADLLAAMSRELGRSAWLVVATRRDEEHGFVAPPAAEVVRLEPGPLSAADTLALAEAVTESTPLSPSLVEQIVERSAGSPQFLRDLLRAAADGVEELPESIEAAAMARMDRLAPDDRAIVRRAAVLGMTFEPRLLVHVLDEGAPQPDAATWERLSRYFAEDGDGRRRFRRGVVREVAYARLPFATRRRLHAAVGRRLEAELGSSAADHAAILSMHFAQADDHDAAWRYARTAGQRARQEYAYADAEVLYRRALDAARQLDVPAVELAAIWEAVGDAASHTGDPGAAMAAFTAARSAIGDDPLREAELLHRHARVEFDRGRVKQAVRWTMRALRRVEGIDERDAAALRAHLVGTLATIRWRAGRLGEAAELSRQAIAEAEAAGEEAALARACFVLDTALLYAGDAVDGRHFRRALEIYERLGDLDRQAAVLNNMGIAAYWSGRWDDAVALYRRGAEASEAAGDVGNAAFGDCNVGEVLSDQGHTAEAEPLLRRALRVWRGTGNEGGAAFVTALLGRTATRSGDLELARRLLDEAVAAFAAAGAVGDAAWADALRGEAEAHAGDADDALRRADRLLLDHAGTGRLAPLLHRVRGFALAQQGQSADAEGAIGASLAEARLQEEDYEVALSLQAWLDLSVQCGWRPDPRHVRERDRIVRRLGVVRLPGAPAVPVAAEAAAGTSADGG